MFLNKDESPEDPRFARLAARAPLPRLKWTVAERYEAVLWHTYSRMMGETATHTMDGYLSSEQALRAARGSQTLVDDLCTPVLNEQPLLHRRPEDLAAAKCDRPGCLDKFGGWRRTDCEYAICGFLKGNPTRGESELNKSKKDDSRDYVLRRHVWERDVSCRYCRSGPLPYRSGGTTDARKKTRYDHVDPDKIASPDGEEHGSNYVLACERCNQAKGRNLPEEVGMRLLPPPTEDEKAAWKARGVRLFDLPVYDDEGPDAGGEKREGEPQEKREGSSERNADRNAALPSALLSQHPPDSNPEGISAGEVRPETGLEAAAEAPAGGPEPSVSGRVGVAPAPLLPPRTADNPDPLTRRSRRSPPAEPDHPPPDHLDREQGPSP